MSVTLVAWSIALGMSPAPAGAAAGFGITPPYVRNDSLARGSFYEQRIILTRNEPVEDLGVHVTINVPGADDWLSVDRGIAFVMPKGVTQLPMQVRVRVPGNAKYGDYTGNIRVVVSPLTNPTPGTVGISLGAQIDVALTVTDRQIREFAVPGAVRVDDLEAGHTGWGYFFFPGKIRLRFNVENQGNVRYGPTLVALEIRDPATGETLEATANTNDLQTVPAYTTEEVVAELPTRLATGHYRGAFQIMNGDRVVRGGELTLSILPYGSLAGYVGYGFSGLRRGEKAVIAGTGFATLAILGFGIWQASRLVRRKRRGRA